MHAGVTLFEDRMLSIARAVVRIAPAESAQSYLFDSLPAQPGLTAKCLELLQELLAQGCVKYLARQGWRRERFLRDGQPVTGRVWERHSIDELKLRFTRNAFDLVKWLTAEPPDTTKRWTLALDDLSIADQLVVFLAYDCFHDSEARAVWRAWPVFAGNPICHLMYPSDFVQLESPVPDFNEWMRGLGGAILEAMQRPLTAAWLSIEYEKRFINDWKIMGEIAAAQDTVLQRFCESVERWGRRDLARFLLHAATTYCTPDRAAEDVIGGLIGSTPRRLAERYAIQGRAGVLARALARWRDWRRQASTIGYFDEGYAAAQMLLADWEDAGADAAYVNAERLMHELEPVEVHEAGVPT